MRAGKQSPRETPQFVGSVSLQDGHAYLYAIAVNREVVRYDAEIWQSGERVKTLRGTSRSMLKKKVCAEYPPRR